MLRQSVLRLPQTAGHLSDLHSGRLVQRGRREDQRAPRDGDGCRFEESLQPYCTREPSAPEAVGRDGALCRVPRVHIRHSKWTGSRARRAEATSYQRPEREQIPVEQPTPVVAESAEAVAEPDDELPAIEPVRESPRSPPSEFAVAVNRSDPAALALASNGATSTIPIDGAEVKKLMSVMWFRTVLARLSGDWRDRLLAALVEHVPVSDHQVKVGRHPMHIAGGHVRAIVPGDRLEDIRAGCRSTRSRSADDGWPFLGSGCGEAVPLCRGPRAATGIVEG